jgi:hypothetical protein
MKFPIRIGKYEIEPVSCIPGYVLYDAEDQTEDAFTQHFFRVEDAKAAAHELVAEHALEVAEASGAKS